MHDPDADLKYRPSTRPAADARCGLFDPKFGRCKTDFPCPKCPDRIPGKAYGGDQGFRALRQRDPERARLELGIAKVATMMAQCHPSDPAIPELEAEEARLLRQLAKLRASRLPPPWPITVGGALGEDRKRLQPGGEGYLEAKAAGVEFYDYRGTPT
jgi:hypothetical protein